MRLIWKVKRRLIYIIPIITLIVILLHLQWSPQEADKPPTHLTAIKSYLQLHDYATSEPPFQQTTRHSLPTPEQQCTMTSCFNINRCLHDFKVFVYPPDRNEKPGPMYKKFLTTIRDSPYYTSNYDSACLYILNLDTLDRDSLSNEYVKHLPEKLSKLPHWNNGRNHLIFNLFSGSFPDYSEELDFPYGEAMVAKASFSSQWYRKGFDISLPLLSKKHKEKGKEPSILTTKKNLYPINRHYLLVFKGKRYLWGHGSETRSSLYLLHNGKDILMLTTCKHGKNWDQFMDSRCAQDIVLYDRYDFTDLIMNSTFCLVPRGRRLGSFRFLESLQAGCIPVSLSNSFVLPFQEVIDWTKAALMFDERQLLQLPHLLRNFPTESIFSFRIHSQFLWEEYFSSIKKVVFTTLEIIRGRIQRTHGSYIWNHRPGALSVISSYSHYLEDYPFYNNIGISSHSNNYTAVVIATQPAPKGNSPLVLLLKRLCNNSAHLSKIIILWIGRILPKVMFPTHCSAPISILDTRGQKQIFAELLSNVQTDALLLLWEDVNIISDEIEFGYSTWQSFPDRLVGFLSYRHYWDPTNHVWKISLSPNNQYSLISTSSAFIHRYYIYYFTTQSPEAIHKIADTSLVCLDVTLNFLISDITNKPPLKITDRTRITTPLEHNAVDQQPIKMEDRWNSRHYSNCLNMLHAAYGHLSLKYTIARADPVLFGDDVSALKKEFRRIENHK